MASGKDSFILYTKYIHVIRKLSDEMAGKLCKMIFEYVNDNNPQTDDFTLDLIFEPIKQDLKEDLRKWETVCERNRINGKGGGRPRKKPSKPSGLLENQVDNKKPKKPKRTRYDSDSDSDMNNDIEKENTYTEEFKKFNSWLKEHCPSVAKLKTQLTEEEMNYLITTYTKDRFFDIILQMENKKDLTSKYKSVYLTANNWLKR